MGSALFVALGFCLALLSVVIYDLLFRKNNRIHSQIVSFREKSRIEDENEEVKIMKDYVTLDLVKENDIMFVNFICYEESLPKVLENLNSLKKN